MRHRIRLPWRRRGCARERLQWHELRRAFVRLEDGVETLCVFLLAEFKWPFIIVAPTTLKKFATGSGKGDKDMMMMEVFKTYGFSAMDNNECDAYALAAVGQALLGTPLRKLLKPQQEVIDLLKKQL